MTRSAEQREKREEARKRRWAGLCSVCGELERKEGKSWCQRCTSLANKIRSERSKLGKDWDGSPVKLKPVSVVQLVRERLNESGD